MDKLNFKLRRMPGTHCSEITLGHVAFLGNMCDVLILIKGEEAIKYRAQIFGFVDWRLPQLDIITSKWNYFSQFSLIFVKS